MAFDPFDSMRNYQPPRDYSADFAEVRRAHDERAGRFDAEGVFKHLINRVRQFEAQLPDDKEVGLQLANFGVAADLHIRGITYRNPNMIEFIGMNSDGEKAVLVQHISQLNFLLRAISPLKEEEPYRIGFRAE